MGAIQFYFFYFPADQLMWSCKHDNQNKKIEKVDLCLNVLLFFPPNFCPLSIQFNYLYYYFQWSCCSFPIDIISSFFFVVVIIVIILL